jgi:HAD superfamily hydrolase (TIGR01509 family)
MMDEVHGPGVMQQMFEKEYYSCKMGMRKPDAEIFQYVIDENKLDTSSTLFIDDIGHNIKGAESIGIQTLHCTAEVSLFDYFEG